MARPRAARDGDQPAPRPRACRRHERRERVAGEGPSGASGTGTDVTADLDRAPVLGRAPEATWTVLPAQVKPGANVIDTCTGLTLVSKVDEASNPITVQIERVDISTDVKPIPLAAEAAMSAPKKPLAGLRASGAAFAPSGVAAGADTIATLAALSAGPLGDPRLASASQRGDRVAPPRVDALTAGIGDRSRAAVRTRPAKVGAAPPARHRHEARQPVVDRVAPTRIVGDLHPRSVVHDKLARRAGSGTDARRREAFGRDADSARRCAWPHRHCRRRPTRAHGAPRRPGTGHWGGRPVARGAAAIPASTRAFVAAATRDDTQILRGRVPVRARATCRSGRCRTRSTTARR